MKYVMFTNAKTGLRIPVFSSDHTSHCDLRAGKGWVATSAGFYDLRSFTAVGKSESLKMTPHPDDSEICKITLAGMESMLFLVQDIEANLANLRDIQKARRLAGKHNQTYDTLPRKAFREDFIEKGGVGDGE